MEHFRYKENRLFCESVELEEVAQRFGTPLYVYSERSIRDHCRWIEQAMEGIGHLSCYAVKANANREILSILANEGIGADVGSIGELQLAFRAGFPPEKITFSGVGKRDDEIEYALRTQIHSFNVESDEEIGIISEIGERLRVPARILLRVNFDIAPDTHQYTSTGQKSSKFGVDRSRAADILEKAAKLPFIEVLGIHSHIGSQIIRCETFVSTARAVVELVDKLRRFGIPVSHINFGGGFGVQYRDYVVHPSLPTESTNPESDVTTVKLLEAVLPVLREVECTILIQPGRSIIAHAGVLLTRVLYRKKGNGKTFVIVDAGMNDLIRPSLYRSYHQIVPVVIRDRATETVDVVGPLCESGDFFALDRVLPIVERGEYLAILCAGAYGYVLSSNYNGRPRPAEVLVEGESARVVRDRETVNDL